MCFPAGLGGEKTGDNFWKNKNRDEKRRRRGKGSRTGEAEGALVVTTASVVAAT
jgi:hypothetical protein